MESNNQLTVELVNPLLINGEKKYSYTKIGTATIDKKEVNLTLDLFPILKPGSYIKLTPKEGFKSNFFVGRSMERKKILLPSFYKGSKGEDKTIFRNAGFAFINHSGEYFTKFEGINFYLDIVPFQKEVKFLLSGIVS